MNTMPSRDITGNCQGECRDRVFEGEKERQASIQLVPGLRRAGRAFTRVDIAPQPPARRHG